MQKLLALLFSLLLLAGLVGCLAGCGEQTTLDPNNPVTLSFRHVYGEQADAPMNRLVAEFNAGVSLEKGIVVNVTNVTTGEMLCGIGSTASVTCFSDTVTYPDNTTEPMNLHILPLPMSGSEVEYIPQSGVGIASYKTTEQKAEAASVFVRWLTEGKRNLDFSVQTGYSTICIAGPIWAGWQKRKEKKAAENSAQEP